MTKHTPGPWDCIEARTSCGRAFRIGSGEMLSAGPGCCIIYDDYPGNLDNERAANARLIAAAPELLEALTALVAVYDDEFGMVAPEMDAALAAISKATGLTIAKAEGATP